MLCTLYRTKVYLQEVLVGGDIARCGAACRIQVNDLIVEVDGTSLVGVTQNLPPLC